VDALMACGDGNMTDDYSKRLTSGFKGLAKADHPKNRHMACRLRKRRQALGLTQAELACRLGVRAARITRIEASNPVLKMALFLPILAILDVGLDYFMEGMPDA
jgi:DNA-binding XRE family transcriptional regulator